MTKRIDKPDTQADLELKGHIKDSKSFIMVAGAGSGKTTSLVKALNYIRELRGKEMRSRAQRIACITYTVIAEQEIWGDVGNDPLCHVATIHSFLWDQIKPFQEDIRVWVTKRLNEKVENLKKEMANYSARVQQKTKDKDRRDLDKNENFLKIIKAVPKFTYETGSNYAEGILGHDDIIKMAPELISAKPILRKIIAQKYPFLFVDESQDTVPEIIEAFKSIQAQEHDKFCLGFFGDPMQKIYATGVGKIGIRGGWKETTKPENFRCPQKVLSVINAIRQQDDRLTQVGGRKDSAGNLVEGSAQLFILPNTSDKSAAIKKVRDYLAKNRNETRWLGDDPTSGVKILVIVHRMAAEELGHEQLYSIFNDDAPVSFKNGFLEGNAWCLTPFLRCLLPLVASFKKNDQFAVMDLLRNHSPMFNDPVFKSQSAKVLEELKKSVEKLTQLLNEESKATVREVLRFAKEARILELDDRFNFERTVADDEKIDEEDKIEKTIQAYLGCAAIQLWGYQSYIENNSVYSTQQGIKGAEFERVLVILDDEAGKAYTQFSYDKFMGLQEPSANDRKNVEQGKDSVFDRTRRLFYVCCSRATTDLAVVFFAGHVESAVDAFRRANYFPQADIKTIDNIN